MAFWRLNERSSGIAEIAGLILNMPVMTCFGMIEKYRKEEA